MTDNADQIAYWNGAPGARWVANQERLDRMMAPLTEALLDGAEAQRGEAIVDVGCGCGDLAFRLAEAVGADGRVLAVDVSQPMIDHGKAREQTLGAGPRAKIDWCVADAMSHPFEEREDLLISRFGVMFFDNKLRAFTNLRMALKQGGRFAFLTWRDRRDVEWMHAPQDWIASVLPPPDQSGGSIGPFALADAAATGDLLRAAGFRNVSATPIDRALAIGANVDDALALLSETGPAAPVLRDADEAGRERAQAILRARLREHLSDGAVRLNGACWLYRGTT